MKIIGIIDSETLICEVGKSELSYCLSDLGTHHYDSPSMLIGTEHNLMDAHNFKADIKRMLDDIGRLVDPNRAKIDAMFNAVQMFGKQHDNP